MPKNWLGKQILERSDFLKFMCQKNKTLARLKIQPKEADK